MSTYTPDEFAVRGAYNYARGASADSDAGLDAEFDRFIAKIKADAWDEGYEGAARYHDLDTEHAAPNPHRGGRAMSAWDERAYEHAEGRSGGHFGALPEQLFEWGARWQREALLADDVIERAARALYAEDINESIDTPWPDYDSPKNVGRPLYEERARNALLAAIEGDE